MDDIYENRMGDRVGMYFSTWISHLKDCKYTVTPRCRSWNNNKYRDGRSTPEFHGSHTVVGFLVHPLLKVLSTAFAPEFLPHAVFPFPAALFH